MFESFVLLMRVVVGSVHILVGRAQRRVVEVLRPVLG
jgi:hypothetical protein